MLTKNVEFCQPNILGFYHTEMRGWISLGWHKRGRIAMYRFFGDDNATRMNTKVTGKSAMS